MKSFVMQAPGVLKVVDTPEPAPQAHEVLLRPLYSGICMTDIHIYDGSWSMGGMVDQIAPWVTGHEFSAEVVALGPEVTRDLKVGDRVAVNPAVVCGDCLYCRGGLSTFCQNYAGSLGLGAMPGSMAELTVAKESMLFPLPAEVSDLAGALVEPFACGLRVVRTSGVCVGDNVVVLGLDDYNLAVVQWLAGAGVNQIVAVDPHVRRRQAAEASGATTVLDPQDGDVVSAALELMPFGADVVCVAVESYVKDAERYLRQGLEIARRGGVEIVTKVYGPAAFAHLDELFWMKEVSLISRGAFFGDEFWRGGRARGDFAVTIGSLAERKVSEALLAPTVIDFDEVRSDAQLADAFRLYPEQATKAVFRIGSTA